MTDFIAYCNFSDEYLASASRFAIYEFMMDLLSEFLAKLKKQYYFVGSFNPNCHYDTVILPSLSN